MIRTYKNTRSSNDANGSIGVPVGENYFDTYASVLIKEIYAKNVYDLDD